MVGAYVSLSHMSIGSPCLLSISYTHMCILCNLVPYLPPTLTYCFPCPPSVPLWIAGSSSGKGAFLPLSARAVVTCHLGSHPTRSSVAWAIQRVGITAGEMGAFLPLSTATILLNPPSQPSGIWSLPASVQGTDICATFSRMHPPPPMHGPWCLCSLQK